MDLVTNKTGSAFLTHVIMGWGEVLSDLLYSGKFLLGANFHDFRGQTCFRENINCEKMNQERIDDVIMRYELVLV